MASPDAPRFYKFQMSANCTFTRPEEAIRKKQLLNCAEVGCSNCPIKAGLESFGNRHQLAQRVLTQEEIFTAFNGLQIIMRNNVIVITCHLPLKDLNFSGNTPLEEPFTRGGVVFQSPTQRKE